MSYHKYICIRIFSQDICKFVQGGLGSTVDIVFSGIKIYTAVLIKCDHYSVIHSFYLGTWNFLLYFLCLLIHSISDKNSGGSTDYTSNYSPQGSVTTLTGVISDNSPQYGTASSSNYGTLLFVICISCRLATS